MRLVIKDLKCLGCSSGKYSDSRHLLSEEEGRSFHKKLTSCGDSIISHRAAISHF